MSGTISWFEVLGRDAKALRSFYNDLFGWSFQLEGSMGDYGMVASEQAGVGGGVGAAPQGEGWATFYVDVESVEKSIDRAVALGGKVLMPATQLPETTIAVVADPEGHPVGLSGAA